MAFESLTDRLAGVFKKLRGHGKLTEADIKAAMREVRMALLEADVNYKVAKDFCAKVSERAMGQEVMESLTPAQQVVKIVNEELVALMGGEEAPRLIVKNKGQTIIMLCGLQGSKDGCMLTLIIMGPPARPAIRWPRGCWPLRRKSTSCSRASPSLKRPPAPLPWHWPLPGGRRATPWC